MRSTLFSSVALAASATAANIAIEIGNGGLIFSPDSVTANVGDVLVFSWPSEIPHDVVSADFAHPCQPNGLIASPVESGPKVDFYVQVNSTDPMYLYCAVSDHCNLGMVMAVNPSSSQTLAMFKSGATSASVKQPASNPVGGILAAANETPFGAASSMASSMAPASSTASVMSAASSMAAASSAASSAAATSAASSAAASSAAATSAAASAAASSSANAAAMATGFPAAIGAAAVGLAMLI